jgi:hypothetical protein
MTKQSKYLERNLLTAICVIAHILLHPPTSEISLTSRPLYFALLQTFRPSGNPSVQTGHNHVTNTPQGHHKQALKSIPRNFPACHFTTPDCCLLASVSVEMSRIQTHLLEEPFHPVITLTWTNKKRNCTHMPARHNMSGFRVRAEAHNCPLPCEHPHEQKNQKHTTGGIPRWSPTLVLVARFSAYVWQSGRDAQFSLTYGRMC